MFKKDKGFTLIELLAVIVILGIILTIIVTNVVKYIKQAKEGAFKDSYIKLVSEVKNRLALNQLGDSSVIIDCVDNCKDYYNVDNNMSLKVIKVNNDKYLVNVKGINGYENISFDNTSCPKDAGCYEKNVASEVYQNGDIKKASLGTVAYADSKTSNNNIYNSGCNGESNCKQLNYGDNISKVIFSSSGLYIKNNNGGIIIDKNGNELNESSDTDKYENLIYLNNLFDNRIKNCVANCTFKGNDINCSNGSIYSFKKKEYTTSNTSYIEKLANDNYLYTYDNNNQINIFTCVKDKKSIGKPTLNNYETYKKIN